MTSKEALHGLLFNQRSGGLYNYKYKKNYDVLELFKMVLKDLELLEKLEKFIEILKDRYSIDLRESLPLDDGCNFHIGYCMLVGGSIRGLEKDEYELIKEVILGGK